MVQTNPPAIEHDRAASGTGRAEQHEEQFAMPMAGETADAEDLPFMQREGGAGNARTGQPLDLKRGAWRAAAGTTLRAG